MFKAKYVLAWKVPEKSGKFLRKPSTGKFAHEKSTNGHKYPIINGTTMTTEHDPGEKSLKPGQ